MEVDLTYLNSLIFDGEITLYDGEYTWYYWIDYYDEDYESHDMLWDAHCETSNALRESFPDITISDVWADNDSCGFTIKFE